MENPVDSDISSSPDSVNKPGAITYKETELFKNKKKKKFYCHYLFFNGFISALILVFVLLYSLIMLAFIIPENSSYSSYFLQLVTFIVGVFSGVLKQKVSKKE